MGKFDSLFEKHAKLGVNKDDIEYAISAVKNGTKREHILENLSASYRSGISNQQADLLLEDIFKANGGEFKYEKRWAIIYGSIMLLIGLAATFYILYVFLYGGDLIRPILVLIIAIFGTIGGSWKVIQSIRGKITDNEDSYAGY